MKFNHIAVCRTDSIGDVVLTLPLLHTIKEKYPQAKLSFIGRTYTQPIVQLNANVDQFLNWDTVANASKKEQIAFLKNQEIDVIVFVFPDKAVVKAAFWANIKMRIGTIGRVHTLLYCNKKVIFSRKKSELHEAQLNFNLLLPLGINQIPPLSEIQQQYDLNLPQATLPGDISEKLNQHSKHIILHPKSQGSAVEWSQENFIKLAYLLVEKGYTVWFTGTKQEGEKVPLLASINHPQIIATFGRLTLEQLIALIYRTQGIVAASTGPLHLAAAYGKLAVGLFSPKRPIHPGRWKPIGENTTVLVSATLCEGCKTNGECTCLAGITPAEVLETILCFTG